MSSYNEKVMRDAIDQQYGWTINLERKTRLNVTPKSILYRNPDIELAVEAVAPNQKVAKETHKDSTQFIRAESGAATIVVNDRAYKISTSSEDPDSIVIPKNTPHEIFAGPFGFKFYTIYAPPTNKRE